MAGGKAIRRRAKLMERANQGNLHKAAKGRASANLPLPPAPSKDDYKEKLPASLAKMMALKEAASKPSKKRKLEAAAEAPKQQQNKQHSLQPLGVGESSTHREGKQPALLWEQPKKLKQRRKEYLNAKKLKKKAGKKGLAKQEISLVDKPVFGEVVHEPPKVQLKRKHWDPVAAAVAAQTQAASTAGSTQRYQQKQQHQHQGNRPAKSKKPKQDPAMQELREQVIEGYRAGRLPREGHATLDTLRKLVQ